MLIKCEHCKLFESGICSNVHVNFHDCTNMFNSVKPEYAYRYHIAEQLFCAVLDRLLDPKNVKKGNFVDDAKYNWDKLIEELCELRYELFEDHDADFTRENIDPKRVLDECGDVAAYLAAIIEAVKNGVE